MLIKFFLFCHLTISYCLSILVNVEINSTHSCRILQNMFPNSLSLGPGQKAYKNFNRGLGSSIMNWNVKMKKSLCFVALSIGKAYLLLFISLRIKHLGDEDSATTGIHLI